MAVYEDVEDALAGLGEGIFVELEIDGVAAVGDGEQVGEGSAGERPEVGHLVEGRGGGSGDGVGTGGGAAAGEVGVGLPDDAGRVGIGGGLPALIRMGVKTGAAAMEKGSEVVVPADVETVTLKVPRAALGATAKVAVRRRADDVHVGDGDVGAGGGDGRAGKWKPEPARVTGKEEPGPPEGGLMEERVGSGGNGEGDGGSGAAGGGDGDVGGAESGVGGDGEGGGDVSGADHDEIGDGDIGAGAATEAPERKLEPVRVTETAVPWTAEVGVIEERMGAGGATVKWRETGAARGGDADVRGA